MNSFGSKTYSLRTFAFAAMATVTMTFSALAFGGNEGPQAAPGAPSSVVLAFSTMFGGLPTPSSPRQETTEIRADGFVIKTTQPWQGPETQVVKGQLDAGTLLALQSALPYIRYSPIVDLNPQSPQCYDAPAIHNYASVGDLAIEISATVACKRLQKQGFNIYDQTVEWALLTARRM